MASRWQVGGKARLCQDLESRVALAQQASKCLQYTPVGLALGLGWEWGKGGVKAEGDE